MTGLKHAPQSLSKLPFSFSSPHSFLYTSHILSYHIISNMCGSLYRIDERLFPSGVAFGLENKSPPSPPPTNFCSHNSECQCCNYDVSSPLSIMRKYKTTKKVTRKSHKLFKFPYLWHVQTRLSATYLVRTPYKEIYF